MAGQVLYCVCQCSVHSAMGTVMVHHALLSGWWCVTVSRPVHCVVPVCAALALQAEAPTPAAAPAAAAAGDRPER